MNARRVIPVLIVIVLLVVLALPLATPSASARPAVRTPPYSVVTYNSSVDGWALSFDEWLPAGFNASHTYPFVLYLHGIGSSTTWTWGGAGGLGGGLANSTLLVSLVNNASRYGYIFAALNTRSSAGYYENSPCGGPQQQDVLDAIAAEKTLRHISGVYLMGFSMGTMGALAIAGNYPALVTGIALAAPGTDLYEAYAYAGGKGHAALESADWCGVTPTNSSAMNAYLRLMSPARYAPQNFSNVTIWVSAGSRDTSLPNSPSLWPYEQAVNVFYNSTCVAATTYGEPTGVCTSSWPSLHALYPSAYNFRFVWEPSATHSDTQFSPKDVFSFWSGAVAAGLYHSTYPPTAILPGF